MATTRERGAKAEVRAKNFLQENGLTFHCANYTAKTGELDLVMIENSTWVCVEVKYREDNAYGSAVDFVTPAKLNKVRRTFEHFILSKGLNPLHTHMRIDVIALDGDKLQWLKNV
ncbi:YraN family protein [Aestuariibacter sp. A3R04]|uniref:YraN family protein n=1 Tax=Aestuariibacter sp. A3R04 TaxID=2841571 RepID=UPI001C09866A|nr:YraN family protein [Aestuariibacter sp. A3R04]MBU3021459.1 YraN family protein [Aestuariibacter sp. A3R04]